MTHPVARPIGPCQDRRTGAPWRTTTALAALDLAPRRTPSDLASSDVASSAN